MLSVPFVLYVIAFALTLVAALRPQNMPLWIPLLFVEVGLIVGSAVR